MKQFVLDQISITRNAFLLCQDTECLITNMSNFLSLILQPHEILFCAEAEQLKCFAQHSAGKPLQHLKECPKNLNTRACHTSLWQLISKKEKLSSDLPITHMQFRKGENEVDDWFCFKLKISDQPAIFIFIKNPQTQEIALWESSLLPGALMIQFCFLLDKFQFNHKPQSITPDTQQSLYLQKVKLQQEFSSKILKLRKLTQNISASSTLNTLYKTAVETLREVLSFDHCSLILSDSIHHTLTPTYGIDKLGNTVDESDQVLGMEVLDPLMLHAVLHTNKQFEIIENAPLYDADTVVGISWNAIIILRDGDNLLGWISLDNLLNKCALQSDEKEILRLYSCMLSNAIIQKREERSINLLHTSVVQLSHQKTELDICKVAVEFSKEKLKLDRVAIFLSYDDGQTMQGTFGTSDSGEVIDETGFHRPLNKNVLLKLALASDHELVLDNEAPLYHNNKVVGYGWNAAVLLRNHGKVIGFLVLDNLINKRPLTSHNKHLLSLFSTNLAEILSRKRAEESVYKLNNELEHLVEQRTKQLESVNIKLQESNKKLEQLSLVDALTGIANRRHFDESYQREWSTACRNRLNLSIIMLDIDSFKAYNDFYGHQKGDKCLEKVAKTLKQHFRRSGELVSRYGGEEFVILISHAQASDVKRRVQVAIDDLFTQNIEHLKTPLQRITLSAGSATFHINKNIPQHKLLKWADDALYRAKSEGKNRLVVFNRREFNSL